MHLKTSTTGTRLFFLIIVALLSLVVLGAYGLQRLSSYNHTMHGTLDTLEKSTRSVNLARSAQVSFGEQVAKWKDLLIHGNDPAYYKNYLAAFTKQHQATQNTLAALKSLVVELNFNPRVIDDTITIHDSLLARHTEALQRFNPSKEGTGRAADQLVAEMDLEAARTIDGLVEDIVWENHTLQDNLATASDIQFLDAKTKTALCLFVAFLVLGTASFSAMRSLTSAQVQNSEGAEAVVIGQLFEAQQARHIQRLFRKPCTMRALPPRPGLNLRITSRP